MNDPTIPARSPRTRRTVLTGGAAAAVASVLVGSRGEAAAGQPVVQGADNRAGNTRTSLTSSAATSTLNIANTRRGVGVVMVSRGGLGSGSATGNRNTYGLAAANLARRRGNGGAFIAEGRRNDGIVGTSNSAQRAGVVGVTSHRRGAGVVGIGRLALVADGDALVIGDLFVNGTIFGPASQMAGTVALNGSGAAVVTPHAGHESGAKYDYLLTAIGAPMPELHVVERDDGTFAVAGGRPGGTVSWQRSQRIDGARLQQAAAARAQTFRSGFAERVDADQPQLTFEID